VLQPLLNQSDNDRLDHALYSCLTILTCVGELGVNYIIPPDFDRLWSSFSRNPDIWVS
jgi:hypothetical protein